MAQRCSRGFLGACYADHGDNPEYRDEADDESQHSDVLFELLFVQFGFM